MLVFTLLSMVFASEADVETDLPTLLAISATTYMEVYLVHEGLGHLGSCALSGGRPAGFSTANGSLA